MALKTLVNLNKEYIKINHKDNTITFKIQEGPVKEVGKNGCQVTSLIEVAKLIIEGFNKNFPCLENEITLRKLKEALTQQEERTRRRTSERKEGYNK